MKRLLLIPLLALMLIVCASCGGKQSSAAPASATADEAATKGEPKKAVATRPSGERETTAPATEETTAPDTTQDTTAQSTTRPDPSKIPKDNVTSANINPGLSIIQNRVISEMNGLEMTELSIERGSITLERGEIADIAISIEPSNCANKRLSVSAENSCVRAVVKGETLMLSAEKAGVCDVTLTSANGLKVGITVTVTEPETEPREEPTEEQTEFPSSAEEPTE